MLRIYRAAQNNYVNYNKTLYLLEQLKVRSEYTSVTTSCRFKKYTRPISKRLQAALEMQ